MLKVILSLRKQRAVQAIDSVGQLPWNSSASSDPFARMKKSTKTRCSFLVEKVLRFATYTFLLLLVPSALSYPDN